MQIKQTLKKHFKKITAASLLTVLGILHLIFNIPLTIKNLFEDTSAKKISIQNDIEIDTLITTPEEVNLYGLEPTIPDEENFYHKIYPNYKNQGKDKIEVRPKQGRWFPFFIAIPSEEIDTVGIKEEQYGDKPTIIICNSPSGQPPFFETKCSTPQSILSDDKKWLIFKSDFQATPEESIYITFKSQPTILYVGQENSLKYPITKTNEQ